MVVIICWAETYRKERYRIPITQQLRSLSGRKRTQNKIQGLCSCLVTRNQDKTIIHRWLMQGEHKRTLCFQNDTENKCGVLRTSHLHQSIEKLSTFCTHLTETGYVLRESLGRCRDDNPTRPKPCAVSLVIEAMAFVINCLNSGKDRGRGGENTLSFM
jgi:hypothetical protein